MTAISRYPASTFDLTLTAIKTNKQVKVQDWIFNFVLWNDGSRDPKQWLKNCPRNFTSALDVSLLGQLFIFRSITQLRPFFYDIPAAKRLLLRLSEVDLEFVVGSEDLRFNANQKTESQSESESESERSEGFLFLPISDSVSAPFASGTSPNRTE